MTMRTDNGYDLSYKAVIYPGDSAAGYAHIYSLGILGVHVVALSECDNQYFRSRFIKEKYIIPAPAKDHEAFVRWLVEYGKKQTKKVVLIMAEDLYAYIASLYHEELSPYYGYPYLPVDKMDVFFNKKLMAEAASKTSIHVPRALYSPLTDDQISEWQSYPAVLKPQVSRFTFKGRKLLDVTKFPMLFGGKAVMAKDKAQLVKLVGSLREQQIAFCLQKWIPGKDNSLATVMFVARNGHIPSCFIGPKFRQYPPDFGTNCVGTSVYIPELHQYAEEFCRATGFVGPAGMEFKKHQGNGRWYFLEINPRLALSMRRSTLCGVNLSLQQYLLSTGQEMFVKRQEEKGKFYVDLMNDVKGLAVRQRSAQWRLSFKEMIRPYLNCEEMIFNWRDPIPGLIRSRKLCKHLWNLLKVQVSLFLHGSV